MHNVASATKCGTQAFKRFGNLTQVTDAMCSQTGNITWPEGPRCYSFCPAEWYRRAKYLPMNLTPLQAGPLAEHQWGAPTRVPGSPVTFTTGLLMCPTPHIILIRSPHDHST
ncbi:uncharacterized protein ACO6RY_09660 [Pungitius sinensis]